MPKPKPTFSPAGDSSLKSFVEWFLDTDQFTDAARAKLLSTALVNNAWNLCGQMRMFKIQEMPNGQFLLLLTPEAANDLLLGMPQYCNLSVKDQFLVITEVVRQFAGFCTGKTEKAVIAELIQGRRLEAEDSTVVGRSPCTVYIRWICSRIVNDAASASDDNKAFEVDAFDLDGNPQYALTVAGFNLLTTKTSRKSCSF